MTQLKHLAFIGLAAALVAGTPGCGESAPDPAASTPPTTKPITPLIQVNAPVDWCGEHFMPESVCVQCHPDLAAAYKAKGDWCAEHGLPDSQCFKHHPELKEKFIAEFKAKTGKEPPIGGH